MKFEQFKALNPGISEEGLVEDLEEMCGLSDAGEAAKGYCDALDDYYGWGLSKENVLRPVAVFGKKTIIKAKKNKSTLLIVVSLLAIAALGTWWYFKTQQN